MLLGSTLTSMCCPTLPDEMDVAAVIRRLGVCMDLRIEIARLQ